MFDTPEIAIDPVQLARHVGEAVSLSIALGAPDALAYVDPSQFEAAVMNLVVNARDATPPGGSIRVETFRCALAPGEVHVLDHQKFFWPMYWPDHVRAFFQEPGSAFCADSFCVNLWESFTWQYLENLTVREIMEGETEFCNLLRPFL